MMSTKPVLGAGSWGGDLGFVELCESSIVCGWTKSPLSAIRVIYLVMPSSAQTCEAWTCMRSAIGRVRAAILADHDFLLLHCWLRDYGRRSNAL